MGSAAEPDEWEWDPTLYLGSAAYYADGRVAYPPALADALVAAIGLDGSRRLLDVGCGPGSLTLLLAPHFAEAVGIDADEGMVTEAARVAERQQIRNVTWRQLRAEELPADLTPFFVAALAQSFHWMDRPRVARAVHQLLDPDGVLVHVHANTHQGVDGDRPLPFPRPPWTPITALVQRYLGAARRAGQGVRPERTFHDEDAVYSAAGFVDPQRLEVPGRIVTRTSEQVLASVYSLSWCAPHLFGDRLGAFDDELRRLLTGASSAGRFAEEMPPTRMDLWRVGSGG